MEGAGNSIVCKSVKNRNLYVFYAVLMHSTNFVFCFKPCLKCVGKALYKNPKLHDFVPVFAIVIEYSYAVFGITAFGCCD